LKKKIVITGGNGRFANKLKNTLKNPNYFFPSKKELNILNISSIKKYLIKKKAKYLIHCAALSRPMKIHDLEISKSIDTNIIGTANVVKACKELNIKLIYFSTGFVYPGIRGNYKENEAVLPINNYAWSKLGGECAVTMYKKSLILRITMCEKPFMHKKAFYDIEANYIFHDDVIKIIPKILNKNGIINVGGKIQSVYNFAKKNKKNVIKVSGKKVFPPKPSMNVSKINKIMKW
tara:strand:+ start:1242 stop:1943 length:702 start_codon:yes stop_codon:yes gene_type:complete